MLITLEEAVELLQAGHLVVVPTETVYGLAARADDPKAIRRLYAAKRRPAHHPLIVHVFDASQAESLASEWPRLATALAERFWPGPLTLVVANGSGVAPEATGGGQTVGLRAPDHPLLLELLRICGLPLAAPSANTFTRLSPTRVEHLDPELLAHVAGVVDGGACAVGIESTVVDLTVSPPRVLRAGGVSLAELREVAPDVEMAEVSSAKSPGQHHAHYQPRKRVLLKPGHGELAVGLSGGPTLAMPSDPIAYARELYAALHSLDQLDGEEIWVVEPPCTDAWAAVWDRLRKATASDGP